MKKTLKYVIVAAEFNETVVEGLLQGALLCLRSNQVFQTNIEIVRVPGAFEIPAMVNRILRRKDLTAIITLGAVIQGETLHHLFISQAVIDRLSEISATSKVPVVLGVLTTKNEKQALARALAPGKKNKGWEVAQAAVEMVRLFGR